MTVLICLYSKCAVLLLHMQTQSKSGESDTNSVKKQMREMNSFIRGAVAVIVEALRKVNKILQLVSYWKVKTIGCLKIIFLLPTKQQPIFYFILFSVQQTWRKILAGSDEEKDPPHCQSTTCIVMLWHFKHLECTLCFEACSFSSRRNYQSTRKAAVAWRLVRKVCDCKVASLTPPSWPSGNIWVGGGERETLSPPLSNCCRSAHM